MESLSARSTHTRLDRRLRVGEGGLRHLDAGVAAAAAGGCPGRRAARDSAGPRGHRGLVHELRAGGGEPLAERGLLLKHALDVRVACGLLQLLAVHPVAEGVHHADLEEGGEGGN